MKFISITPEKNNADQFIKITSQMPAFVKLYSPSCGHCVAMQDAWDALKNQDGLTDYNMAIIEVHSNELDNIDSPAMKVNGGFPTIRKVLKNGKLGKDYNGDRSTKDMVKFIQEEFKETLNKGMTGGGIKKKSKKKTRKSKKVKKRSKKTKKRKSKGKRQ